MSAPARPRSPAPPPSRSPLPDPPAANRRVFFYIPANFNPSDFPSLAQYQADHVYWPLHKIVTAALSYRHQNDRWINISRETFRTFLHPSFCRQLQDDLLASGVLQCNGRYVIGVHSKGWKLGPKYRGGSLRKVEVTNPAMIAKILRHRIRIGDKVVPERQIDAIYAHLLHWLRRVSIDAEAAHGAIDHLKPIKAASGRRNASEVPPAGGKTCSDGATPGVGRSKSDGVVKKLLRRHMREHRRRQAMCRLTVDQIQDQTLDFTVDHQGRVHTPITRLLSDARNYLSIDGTRLVGVDIRNSQLVFLSLLLLERQYGQTINAEESGLCTPRRPSAPFHHRSPPSGTSQASGNGRELAPPHAPEQNLLDARPVVSEEAACTARGRAVLEVAGGEQLTTEPTVQPDLQEFVSRVMDGSIYDHLLAEFNGMDNLPATERVGSRREFKTLFFRDVLYGNTDLDRVANSSLAVLFRVVYPSVWAFIVEQKGFDGTGDPNRAYPRLAVRMQQREARFMYGRVVARLAEHHPEVPVLTIHDSILTTSPYLDLVERVMASEFERLNVRPSLRIEQ